MAGPVGAGADDGVLDDGVLDDGVLDDGVLDDGVLDDGVLDDGVLDDGVLDDGLWLEDGRLDDGWPLCLAFVVLLAGRLLDDGWWSTDGVDRACAPEAAIAASAFAPHATRTDVATTPTASAGACGVATARCPARPWCRRGSRGAARAIGTVAGSISAR